VSTLAIIALALVGWFALSLLTGLVYVVARRRVDRRWEEIERRWRDRQD
jgi:hypothetical protein